MIVGTDAAATIIMLILVQKRKEGVIAKAFEMAVTALHVVGEMKINVIMIMIADNMIGGYPVFGARPLCCQ